MKHLNTYTEHINEWVSNLSKVRNFPTYGDSNRFDDKKAIKKFENETDFYSIYNVNKHDIGKYLNTWFKGKHSEFKTYVTNDEMWTVKKVDKDTAMHLYNQEYNPVSIRIVCPTGVKFIKNEQGEDLYNMVARIHSIDDSSYGIWFNQIPYSELEDIRTNIMKWMNTKPLLNGEEFLDYCVEMGADQNEKDYN